MRALLALLLVLASVSGGAVLGAMLAAPPHGSGAADAAASAAEPEAEPGQPGEPASYVKLGRQLIVPVVEGGRTRALMLFEIALDVPAEHHDSVFQTEPRLRDAFLRELFEMSYAGAFLGTYTSDRVMTELREKLLAAARLHVGERVSDVLVLDALRQEL